MTYKTAGEISKVITITAILVSALAILAAYILTTKELKQQQKKIIVIDTKGRVYRSELANAKEMRIFEYRVR